MALSKKKLRNKAKADRRVTPKAKKRAKVRGQIERREHIKASKRQAAGLQVRQEHTCDTVHRGMELLSELQCIAYVPEPWQASTKTACKLQVVNNDTAKLEGVRAVDPDMYAFLLRNLEFVLELGSGGRATQTTLILSAKRLDLLQTSALESFISAAFLVHVFRASKQSPVKAFNSHLVSFDLDATRSLALRWCLQHWPGVLRSHLGTGTSGAAAVNGTTVVVQTEAECLAQSFLEEVMHVLEHAERHPAELLQVSLRVLGNADGLDCWWQFDNLRMRCVSLCLDVWALPPHDMLPASVSLAAFLVIRNAVAFAIQGFQAGTSWRTVEGLFFVTVLRFCHGDDEPLCWQEYRHTQLMTACILELLRTQDQIAYKVAYISIQRIAQSVSAAGVSIDAPIVTWQFMKSVQLWSAAVRSLPALSSLARPYMLAVQGAMKTQLLELHSFPFVFHCVRCLSSVSQSSGTFLPLSSYILKVLSLLMRCMDAAHKRPCETKLGGSLRNMVDVRISLRAVGDLGRPPAADAIAGALLFLLTEHWSSLSCCASFPELSAAACAHLRRYRKRCPSEQVRKRLQQLLDSRDATVSVINSHRDMLQPEKMSVLMSSIGDSPLTKAYHSARRKFEC